MELFKKKKKIVKIKDFIDSCYDEIIEGNSKDKSLEKIV